MSTPLTITPGLRADGTPVLTVTGEIDMSNTSALTAALRSTSGHVIVDLSAVGYLDSAGLAVLFAFADRIELVSNPYLAPVLDISGLSELIAIQE